MIKKDCKHFMARCFAAIAVFALASAAAAVEPAPATTGLTAQVLKLAGNATTVPSLQYKQHRTITVLHGASTNAPVFSVATSGSVPICKITPVAVDSVSVEGLAVGKCKLLVNQDGDASYAKAAELVLSFDIVKATQVISTTPFPAGEPFKVGVPVESYFSAGDSRNEVKFTSTTNCKVSLSFKVGVFIVEPLAIGLCKIAATQAGNTNYVEAVYGSRGFAMATAGDSSIEFTSATSAFYLDTLSLTFNKVGSTRPITVESTTFDVCTVDPVTKKMTSKKTGLCKLRAEVLGDNNYTGAVKYGDVQILMTSGNPLVLGGINSLLVDASANLTVKGSGSSMPVVLTSLNPGNCSLDGVTVKGNSAGDCEIVATQAGDANYHTALSVRTKFSINKKPQVISIKPIPAVKVGQQHMLEVMESNSTLPVFFKAADNCTALAVLGNTIFGLNAGTCSITATRPGNNQFEDAPPVVFSMSIQKTEQGLEILSANSFGRGGFTTVGASSKQPITPSTPINISVAPPSICTLEANQIKGVGLGTCTVSATQVGDANYIGSTVTKQVNVVIGASTLKFEQLPPLRVNDVGGLVVVSSSYAGTPITVSASPYSICWYDAATKILTGLTAGDCIVTANQAGDAEYLPANEIRSSVRVLLGSPVIYFPQVSPVALNAGSIVLQATTSAKPSEYLPVTFESLTPLICSVSGTSLTPVAAGTCKINATQVGNANYTPSAAVLQDITILAPATTTTVSSSINPAKRGTMVTLTATVSGNAVTGLVGFTSDGIEISHCKALQLVAGVATCSTNQFAVGKRQIVANYGGDAKNQSSQSATFEQSITSLDWLPAILNLLLNN